MSYRRNYEVSVVLPFNDDEDVIGTAVKRVAEHLRELELSFEIIAVDEYSGDNSHAVLALLRRDYPELRIVHVGARGRGYDFGTQRAMGRVLWLTEPTLAASAVSAFARAFGLVERGERDLVVIGQRLVVAHRMRTLPALHNLKGLGAPFHRRLVKRAAQRRLSIESHIVSEQPTPRPARPLARLLGVFATAFADDR